MAAAGVPTAGARTCASAEEVAAALDAFGAPYVVKDDALAAGKGVVVTRDRAEAQAHAARAAGGCVVEEFLDGPEVSLFAICDGTTAYAAPAGAGLQADLRRRPRAEHRRHGLLHAADLGASPTSPTSCSTTCVRPTLGEMAGRGTPFVGCLYVGLALTEAGPRVIEFNARFGDPDIQPRARRCSTRRSASCCAAAAHGRLADVPAPVFRDGAAVTVVLASAGYPESSSKGDVITGVDAAGRARASTSSTPAPRSTAASSSPRAAACSPSSPSAPTSPTPARGLRGRGPGRLPRRPAPHRHRGALAGPGSSRRRAGPELPAMERRSPRPGDLQRRAWENDLVTVPNVLATRYASADLAGSGRPSTRSCSSGGSGSRCSRRSVTSASTCPTASSRPTERSSRRSTSRRSPRGSG